MEKRFKLFFFGFGQVAKYFLSKLIQEKYNFEKEKPAFAMPTAPLRSRPSI